MTHHPTTHVELTTLSDVHLAAPPDPADVMTVLVELPPGDPGSPPHRHSGPVFGYVLDGTLRYEIEGGPARELEARADATRAAAAG